jgi:hypothetical protein
LIDLTDDGDADDGGIYNNVQRSIYDFYACLCTTIYVCLYIFEFLDVNVITFISIQEKIMRVKKDKKSRERGRAKKQVEREISHQYRIQGTKDICYSMYKKVSYSVSVT